MRQRQRKQFAGSLVRLLPAGISFSAAAVCASGVILANDMVGRLILATTWVALGIAWIGRYATWHKHSSRADKPPGAA